MKENLQKIFDTVSNHLLTQNQKAINDIGNCKYRYGNLKCAAGCLISDSDYEFFMEGFSVLELEYFKNRFDESELKLLSKLQTIHDQYPVKDWKSKLDDLKKEILNHE